MAEVAGLVLGVIPIALRCSRAAFDIHKVCINLGGEFKNQRDELRRKINHLMREMKDVKDTSCEGTTLKEDVEEIEKDLNTVLGDLKDLIPLTKTKRLKHYNKIQEGLQSAIGRLDYCVESFQSTRLNHLVKSGDEISCRLKTVSENVSTSNANLTSMNNTMDSFQDLIQQQLALLMSQRPAPPNPLNVRVRSLGSTSNFDHTFAVGQEETVARIIKRMRDENEEVESIHFFSWSANRHTLTENGYRWRYRNNKVPISTIAQECGTNNGQIVDWRLEYVRNPTQFTLFLVHGLQQETGLPIPLPIESIQKALTLLSNSAANLAVKECKELQSGRDFDWNNPSALSSIRPLTCSLCIKIAPTASSCG